ncbi:sulfite exporter TauE/SafE family protein [Roseobacter sp. YSTF-M11]|uniref:Probable membrane transporter protein n=1 Tax=Roseobacter insulae TaxID=2859783 RepID=A0A9X1FSX4_9RHOB|nr:sulfite exporter TauE/SafE family protein [Roseobacter insulae]MBW4707166.1 sulfite exporter TauE/SafE family protein [Roseobacter insulae]
MEFTTLLLVAAIAFLISGAIKGVAGIGLPTAAIALMTLFFDPRTAIALVLFPMIGSNAWQVFRAGHLRRTARRYAMFAGVLLVGVAATTFVTQNTGDRALLAVLGVVILVFVAVSWRGLVPPLPEHHDRKAQIGFGLLAGVVGGMTAGWGAPLAMYLATKRVDKDEFVRATGYLIFVGSLPLCIAYAQLGFLTGPLAGASAIMLIPAIAGFSAGEVLRNRLSAAAFRNAILILFVFLGLNLLRRAIWYS